MSAAIITTKKSSPFLTRTPYGMCLSCKAGTCIVHVRISEGVLPRR